MRGFRASAAGSGVAAASGAASAPLAAQSETVIGTGQMLVAVKAGAAVPSC